MPVHSFPYKLPAGFSQTEYFLGAEFPAEGTGIFLRLFGFFCAGNGNYAGLRLQPVEGDLCRRAPVFLSQLAQQRPHRLDFLQAGAAKARVSLARTCRCGVGLDLRVGERAAHWVRSIIISQGGAGSIRSIPATGLKIEKGDTGTHRRRFPHPSLFIRLTCIQN